MKTRRGPSLAVFAIHRARRLTRRSPPSLPPPRNNERCTIDRGERRERGSRPAGGKRGTKGPGEKGGGWLDPRLDSVTTTLVNVLWNRAGARTGARIGPFDGRMDFSRSSSFSLLLSYAFLCIEREREREGGEERFSNSRGNKNLIGCFLWVLLCE